MGFPNTKSYHRPTELAQVFGLLARAQERDECNLILGGGTFLHGLSARGLLGPVDNLVDLSALPLAYVHAESDRLRIGATTSLQQLRDQLPGDAPWLMAIHDAMVFPPPQIRNAATVGGNLGAGCPFFDLPVVMECLDATLTIANAGGERQLAMADLNESLFQTSLAEGELITEILLSKPAGLSMSAYQKLETNANDLALISAGLLICVDDDGTVNHARIVVGGGIGEIPVRCQDAEAVLIGATLTGSSIDVASQAAFDFVDPISDHRASSAYRKQMVNVLLRRNLGRIASKLSQES